MRIRILLALVIAAGTIAALPARAEMRTYWDATSKQWLVADDKSREFRRASRDRIPREMVAYDGAYPPGTIIVDTDARRLYFVIPGGKAIKYAIGVGREGYTWSGTDVITNKAEWPTWKPPAEMIAREKAKGHILQETMPGGLDNPLGARALYIGFSFYRIHGTTDPRSVGHAVSSGCIRLTNEDIIDLYDRVRLGTRVVVLLKSPMSGVASAAAPGTVPKPRLNPLPKVLAKAEPAKDGGVTVRKPRSVAVTTILPKTGTAQVVAKDVVKPDAAKTDAATVIPDPVPAGSGDTLADARPGSAKPVLLDGTATGADPLPPASH
ncbi:MAG TPA: L,D-transpeptidase family protein [Bauldia sp.]|nr:L,D-transpeptidase family protein [Bauldia sp.]